MIDIFKKKKAESKAAIPTSKQTVKAVYIMTFTAKEMPPDELKAVVPIAQGMLKGKDPAFAQLWSKQMQPKTQIEISNVKYAGPMLHTPQAMQATLAGWIKNQYNVDYKPEMGKNFFPHGMRDPQGKENFFLFYFDVEAA